MQKQIQHTMLIVIATTLVIVTTGMAQQMEATSVLSPKELINKMADAYSSCKSYKDKGVVTTIFLSDDGEDRTTKRPFTTAFVRPDRFRFEFKSRRREEEWKRYIVWRDGESVRKWWSIRPVIKKMESFSRAIAGATGVSGSSAHTIPRLLMPDEVGGNGLIYMTDLELLEDENVDGVPCFKIQGKYTSEQVRTIWIEKSSYLVRKIFRRRGQPDNGTETTTTYDPQFKVDVQPEDLKFDPPASVLTHGKIRDDVQSRPSLDLQKASFSFDDNPKLRTLLYKYHTQYDWPFHGTISYLTSGYLSGSKWHYYAQEQTSDTFASDEKANVLIGGHCTSDTTLSNGGIVFICGDLKGKLTVKGHGEIIIAGNVNRDGQIHTDGIVRMMIGGRVDGLISNKGSSKIFIVGDFAGSVVTGDPSTILSISGDYAGDLSPTSSRGSLLRIIIEGFMPYDRITHIRGLRYTQVTGFVGKSNMEEGVLGRSRTSQQTWYIASEAENKP